jgi:hypothetical protein
MKYDALLIAEREFQEDILPISISRPTPQKKKDKLAVIKEEKVSDEEIAEKEKEVEKEIVESAAELGFVKEDEAETGVSETVEE